MRVWQNALHRRLTPGAARFLSFASPWDDGFPGGCDAQRAKTDVLLSVDTGGHACTAEGWVFGRRTKILGWLPCALYRACGSYPCRGTAPTPDQRHKFRCQNRGRAHRKTSCGLEGRVTKFVVVGSFNQPWRIIGDAHTQTTAFSGRLCMPLQAMCCHAFHIHTAHLHGTGTVTFLTFAGLHLSTGHCSAERGLLALLSNLSLG